MTLKLSLFLGASWMLGCGGAAATAEPAHAGNETAGPGCAHAARGGHGEEHGAGQGAVHSFHETIRPIWHSEPGAARAASACAKVEEFQTKANAVATEPAPEGGNADAFAAASSALTASVQELGAACTSGTVETQEAALTSVHTAFHSVMEARHP